MALFTPQDQARIAAAIAEAERTTSGEIVCVVARSASDYRTIPVVWAAMAALAFPWPMLRFTSFSPEAIHIIQLGLFLLLALALWLAPWRLALVPGFIMRHRARLAAREQFVTQELYRTAGRTGCLIYVAEAEHYVEVLADEGIAAKVDVDVWKQAVEALTDALKAGQGADGMIRAIAICGAVLQQHCPPVPQDANELPNRLIIL